METLTRLEPVREDLGYGLCPRCGAESQLIRVGGQLGCALCLMPSCRCQPPSR